MFFGYPVYCAMNIQERATGLFMDLETGYNLSLL